MYGNEFNKSSTFPFLIQSIFKIIIVGLLDIDLCGPSIPKMLNLSGKEIHQCDEGWLPVFTDDSQTLRSRPFGLLLVFRLTVVQPSANISTTECNVKFVSIYRNVDQIFIANATINAHKVFVLFFPLENIKKSISKSTQDSLAKLKKFTQKE